MNAKQRFTEYLNTKVPTYVQAGFASKHYAEAALSFFFQEIDKLEEEFAGLKSEKSKAAGKIESPLRQTPETTEHLAMKKPSEVLPDLSMVDLRAVADLVQQIEIHLKDHDEYKVNILVPWVASEEVWKEVVRQAQEASWDALREGAYVSIKRP